MDPTCSLVTLAIVKAVMEPVFYIGLAFVFGWAMTRR